MEFVTHMIAVGGADDARDIDALRQRGIGAVLSLLCIEPLPARLPHAVVEIADRQALSSEAINSTRLYPRSRQHRAAGARPLSVRHFTLACPCCLLPAPI
jgi:hypothetical protein